MKTEIIERNNVYPCLMKSKSGLIILFTEEEIGTVIIGNNTYKSGEFRDGWIMSRFHKFEGKLIIEND